MIDRRTLVGGAAALGAAAALPARAAAEEILWPPPETFRLWPGEAPGLPSQPPIPRIERNGWEGKEQWLRGVVDPIVGVFRPAKPDGRAVLAIPGGGYQFVSVSNEGIEVADALTPHGITVFVLAYRLPGEGWANRWDVPLQDAQRAMRLIRARAATWKIDPARLGICGFSAGGHLAASLMVGHDDAVYPAVDEADKLSARPAYSGLVYAVARGWPTLLGPDPTPEIVARYATDARITATTPPMFLLQAFDDPVVNAENSFGFMYRAHSAKVPVEAHFLEKGGHGFGARHIPEDLPGRLWTEMFARWTLKH
jgi:acetyl esterase/lipase